MGYRHHAWYGAMPEHGAPTPEVGALSEKDVMNVVHIVAKQLQADPKRIFLWGISMGGGGAQHLAAKYNGVFAAAALIAPAPLPAMADLVPDMATLPLFIAVGKLDPLIF